MRHPDVIYSTENLEVVRQILDNIHGLHVRPAMQIGKYEIILPHQEDQEHSMDDITVLATRCQLIASVTESVEVHLRETMNRFLQRGDR